MLMTERYSRRERVKDNSKIFSLSNYKNAMILIDMENIYGKGFGMKISLALDMLYLRSLIEIQLGIPVYLYI